MIPKITPHQSENPYAIKSKQDSPDRQREKERDKDKDKEKEGDHHALAYSQKHKGVVVKEHLSISHKTIQEVKLNKAEIVSILDRLNGHSYYHKKGLCFSCPDVEHHLSSSEEYLLTSLHFEIKRPSENKLVQRLSGEVLYNLYLKVEQEHSSSSAVNLLDISC